MKKYVRIFSNEERFSRMLSLELAEIGVETIYELENDDIEAQIFALVDLDSFDEGTLSEIKSKVTVIGYSRKTVDEIGRARELCNTVLHRPFPISSLLFLFGHSDRIRHTLKPPSREITENRQNKLTVDQNSKNAIWGDEVIPLSDNEYKVLTLLYQNRGETVNRETIDMLLGADDSNMGDVYVCHLRKKIDNKLGLKLIYTIRGKGYMLKS